MLVLSRRIGEEIVIANEIHVTVLAIQGGRVRLGIAAPRSVPVTRLELLDSAEAATPTTDHSPPSTPPVPGVTRSGEGGPAADIHR